jgi:dTDP-4-amino-4,6-dideoxygalactose transaminase
MGHSTSETLAIDGGEPVRTTGFHAWPVWDESEEQALLRVLRSGRWGIGGDEIEAFEKEFARAHEVKHAYAVPTGSAALEVALWAAGVSYGDEVIVPPYTFFATASACLMRGAIPVFADIDAASYCLDPAAVEAAITERTRAIIPVHIGGCPANMDALNAIGKKHKLTVIEDACQAHGAAWRGKPVGSVGDFGCFSFQSSKNINSGEGGAVTTNDDDLAARCWSFKNYGRDPQCGWYHHANIGTNFRPSQFQAAVLRAQLARMENWAARRAENGAYLAAGLREIGGLLPQEPDAGVTRHAYHLFITRYDAAAFGGWTRERFIEALAAEGIPAAPGYGPLYAAPGIAQGTMELKRALKLCDASAEYSLPNCPNTEKAGAGESVWLLGQSALLGTRGDMDDALRAVAKIKKAAGQG